MRTYVSIIGVLILLFLVAIVPLNATALTPEEKSAKLSVMDDQCANQMIEMLEKEKNVYRDVQYGVDNTSVLGTHAETQDLIPYLTLNYHALQCRLRMVCDAVGASHGDSGDSMPLNYRPIGCSRLFAARGRWWTEDRRDKTFAPEPIEECAYFKYAGEDVGYDVPFAETTVEEKCDELVDQVLLEERQMLRLLVAQDSANRGARSAIGVFQEALKSVRNDFLYQLRNITDFFGSVLHPIPCLLTQCT